MGKSKTSLQATSCEELRLKPERLHPDLEKCVREGPLGPCLDHPLVQALSIDRQYAASANYTYNY